MASPSPTPATSGSKSNDVIPPVNRHALTPVEKQRAQLSKLLKDPAKPVVITEQPKERTVRPPRDMMKNVQGSSAGAGSGEFHVYKANRRREYERLKIMEEQSKKVRLLSFYLDCISGIYLIHRKLKRLSLSGSDASARSRQKLRPSKIVRSGRRRRNARKGKGEAKTLQNLLHP